MSAKNRILEWAKKRQSFRTAELVSYLKISRQNVSLHLRRLVEAEKLLKVGSTRGASYRVPSKGGASRAHSGKTIALFKRIRNLQEDLVFKEMDRKLGLSQRLPANTHTIAGYAFTEMLNNAIDHSKSKVVRITASVSAKEFAFSVRDFGIGAFFNVTRFFKLESELHGLEHLFKGKQTTDPERHSGEGIFFTSKIADRFLLRSHRLTTTIDNELKDTFIKEGRPIAGTLVEFTVKTNTRKVLSKLFGDFTNADFDFDRSHVNVKLSAQEGYLSRSQAKRVLQGLEKYRRVAFDFSGVRELGQGFADEIFRVFQAANPKMEIEWMGAVPAVEMMIRRATRKGPR